MVFKLGDKVEVRSDEDGFVGVWYSAQIVRLENAVSCIVEYYELQDDRGLPLQEEALFKNVRPLPPDLGLKSWTKADNVEAYDRDGWWAGVISRVLSKDMFLVYFCTTSEELAFPRVKLRCILEWQDGKWLNYTQVARLERQIAAFTAKDFTAGNQTKPGRKRQNSEISGNRCVASLPESKLSKERKKPRSLRVVHSSEAETSIEEQRDGSMAIEAQHEEGENASEVPMRLELTAYRWLMQALYSKGPLNWKQEVLLTDVRCQLEITNMEHASVLRTVLSSTTKQ